jgi:HEAT repeat protein
MDDQALEAALAEVGKAFRLCRFYPSAHPSVKQALADLAKVLPTLGLTEEIELKVAPAGFALGAAPAGARNPQLQEFAGLLFAQGHRALVVEPGVTADEFAQLIRSVTSLTGRPGASVASRELKLPHLHLESALRKSAGQRTRSGMTPVPPEARRGTTPVPPEARTGSTPVPPEAMEAPSAFGVRSTGVFRPNALPADVEAHRLVDLLAVATPEGARSPLARLADVIVELVVQRDYRTLAEAAAALARWRRAEDAAVAEAAQRALAACSNDGTLSGIAGVLVDGRATEEQREAAATALGALGERAMPLLFDAYLAAPDDASREAYAQAVEAMGMLAVAYLGTRAAAEVVVPARAAATLLGSVGLPGAVAVLGAPARHADAGVRRAAVASLARLGGSDAARLVVGALRDADAGVRFEAAGGVARLGARAFAGIVLGRLMEEADDGVSVGLIETLGRLKEPRAVPHLAELARGAGVFRRRPLPLRVAAVRALAHIGTPEALAAVEPFKSEKNFELRNAALEPPS